MFKCNEEKNEEKNVLCPPYVYQMNYIIVTYLMLFFFSVVSKNCRWTGRKKNTQSGRIAQLVPLGFCITKGIVFCVYMRWSTLSKKLRLDINAESARVAGLILILGYLGLCGASHFLPVSMWEFSETVFLGKTYAFEDLASYWILKCVPLLLLFFLNVYK